MEITHHSLKSPDAYEHSLEGAAIFLLHSLVYWKDSHRRANINLDRFYAAGQIAACDTAFRVLTGLKPEDALLLSCDEFTAQIGGAASRQHCAGCGETWPCWYSLNRSSYSADFAAQHYPQIGGAK